jgi:hypothetical protein
MTLRCLRLVDRERGEKLLWVVFSPMRPSLPWSPCHAVARPSGGMELIARAPPRLAKPVERRASHDALCGERVGVSGGGHLSPRSGRRKNQILRHFLYETQKSMYNFPDGPIEPGPRSPGDEEPGKDELWRGKAQREKNFI